MAETYPAVLFCMHIANFLLAAYLFKYLFSAYTAKRFGSFAKSTRITLVAVASFLVVELVQVFKFFSKEESEFIQALFTLVFLALLLFVARELVKSGHAHDHLMKRRLRMKMSDVE
jgi:hypothetical protein